MSTRYILYWEARNGAEHEEAYDDRDAALTAFALIANTHTTEHVTLHDGFTVIAERDNTRSYA